MEFFLSPSHLHCTYGDNVFKVKHVRNGIERIVNQADSTPYVEELHLQFVVHKYYDICNVKNFRCVGTNTLLLLETINLRIAKDKLVKTVNFFVE